MTILFLFAGTNASVPLGGVNDLISAFWSIEEAQSYLLTDTVNKWAHIAEYQSGTLTILHQYTRTATTNAWTEVT